MPNKKISELTEVTSIIGSDVLAIVNSGVTKKIKAENLAAFVDPNATLRTLSAEWQSTYTTVNANSASWGSGGSSGSYVGDLSANWESTYTTVNANSALWDYQGTDLKDLSADWVGGNAAFTNLVSNSAAYLSGVDLSFLSVSANWDSVYNSVASTSANWDSVYSSVATNSATYATTSFVQTNFLPVTGGSVSGVLEAGSGGSTTLFVSAGTVGINTETPLEALTVAGNISSSNIVFSNNGNSNQWNSVYTNVASNSATYATINFTNSKFFPLTGGLISGETRINGNVTIFGDLSSSGTQTFANTIFTTTSALSIVNIGSGPALVVSQNGSGDIASFYDIDENIEIVHIGGQNSIYPNVGIKVSNPNKDFTVKGELSASGDIWTTGRIMSGGQELLSLIQPSIASVYTTVQSKSATEWDNSLSNSYARSNFLPLSGGTISGNLSATGVISASASNIKVNVVNDSTNRIFTDADNNKVVHIDTTTTSLCAIFPSSLCKGFNVAIMNVGTNNLVLSAAQLNSAGTTITTRYGGAFVYKNSNSLFAVGKLV